jgi:hypothetical protein
VAQRVIDVRHTALAHDYFLGLDTRTPKQVETEIDLSDISMWCNFGADEFASCIPHPVQIVTHQVEPVDRRLVLGKLKVLQVPVRGGKGNGVTVLTSELIVDILGKLHEIGRILCSATSIILIKSAIGDLKGRNSAKLTSCGIFPVQVHSIETVSVHELDHVVDELFAIRRRASHVTES